MINNLQECLTFDDISIIPQFSSVASRSNCVVKTKLTHKIELDIPIVSAPMETVTGAEMAIELARLGGIGFLHRFCSIDDQCTAVSKVKNVESLMVGAAVGVTENFLERVKSLVDCYVDVILIDVAHGHHELVRQALDQIKSYDHNIQVIAGNVVTSSAVAYLQRWGADGIRVGIGNGSLCETRIRTGIGVPQATAINNCTKEATVPIIADGGIRTPADICKALALGASTVMLGSLLAGTQESPGDVIKQGIFPNFAYYKKYQGSASLDSKALRKEQEKYIEGNSTLIPVKGNTEDIVGELMDGLRSCMSYVGSSDIGSMRRNTKFIKVTPAGAVEAHPHLLLSNKD